MERDEFGRFLKGNTQAKGNKGNKLPKWHNSNASKIGYYTRYTGLIHSNNKLYVVYKSESVAVIDVAFFKTIGNMVYVANEMVNTLIKQFHFPQVWFIDYGNQEGYKLFIGAKINKELSLFFHYFADRTVITPRTSLTMKELTRKRFEYLYHKK